jgi:hypothetical protein
MAFLVVQAINPSKYINAHKEETTVVWLRKYEIHKECTENDGDVTDDELMVYLHQ